MTDQASTNIGMSKPLKDPDARRPSPPQNTASELASFPKSPSQFDADYRISFSRLDNKYILEAEDGSEWEWDAGLRRWVQQVDDVLLEQQRQAYKVAGVDDGDETAELTQKQRRLKRKHEQEKQDNGEKANNNKTKKARVNTAIYVSHLPPDTTVDELSALFSRYGVIAEEIDTGRPRIKMYTDEAGVFKGDALIVYFRPESVQLAMQMLDDSDFRLGQNAPDGERMRVQPADFSFKEQKEIPTERNTRDKKRIMKKTQKLNNKLADWDDDDPMPAPGTSRWDKVVILKHMFTLKELEDDPAAILEIKEDIREECSKLGNVTNVVLYDREEDGVASVKFTDPDAAAACVMMMKGRFFGGTQVDAYIADGRERFRKSNKGVSLDDEGSEDERLNKFGSWLEES